MSCMIASHLLQCVERGAFIDLGTQYRDCVKVRKNCIGISLVCLRLDARADKKIITKQHTMFLWSILSSEQLTRDQKALFLLARSYDALRRNS